ncbi:UNVERIFIED_CONTAM: hypothetical protein RMT77_015344 [Armadillidium vulgare]
MSSLYVRKTNRANWSEESMINAVSDILEKKKNFREASSYYKIPLTSLNKRVKDMRETGEMRIHVPLGSLKPVFTFEQEEELVRCINEINIEERTDLMIRKMAYKFAVSYGRKNKFNKVTAMAGKVWLKAFLSRHPDLSFRNTETKSVVPPSESNLSQGSTDSDNHEISEMEPTGKAPKELETIRTQMGQEVDFLNEDQPVSENEPWEDQPASENEPSEDQPISENEPSEDESLHDPEITPIKIKHTEITDEFLSALNKSCSEFLLVPKISPQKLGMNCQNPERCSFDVDSAFKISFKDFTLQRKSFVKEREPPTWVTDPKPFRVRRGTMFNKRQIEISKDKAENDDQMKMMHCKRIE